MLGAKEQSCFASLLLNSCCRGTKEQGNQMTTDGQPFGLLFEEPVSTEHSTPLLTPFYDADAGLSFVVVGYDQQRVYVTEAWHTASTQTLTEVRIETTDTDEEN